ncbi:MAG TPA: MauE/DoxX family redox-associated membrane protein [Mycobacteriales bacterium]|nr:MauE/DoxX family redox-associated membrane protein [Mycobacteriales bacterium]
MPAFTAMFLAAAGLLALAAASKLVRPAGTAQALRTQGLPSSTGAVRLLGLVELAVAAAALAGSRAGALALALAYAGFTGFVVTALVRGRPLTSCGCFAEPDLPPTWAHPVVTGALAAAGVAVAVGDPAGLPQAWAAGAWPAAGAVAAAALIAWLARLVLADLPALVAAAAVPVPAPQTGRRLFSIPSSRSTP